MISHVARAGVLTGQRVVHLRNGRGTYWDADGVLKEAAEMNYARRSEALTHSDWVKDAQITIEDVTGKPGAPAAPEPGLRVFKVTDAGGNNNALFRSANVVAAASTGKAHASIYAMAGTIDAIEVAVRDTTASANRATARVTGLSATEWTRVWANATSAVIDGNLHAIACYPTGVGITHPAGYLYVCAPMLDFGYHITDDYQPDYIPIDTTPSGRLLIEYIDVDGDGVRERPSIRMEPGVTNFVQRSVAPGGAAGDRPTLAGFGTALGNLTVIPSTVRAPYRDGFAGIATARSLELDTGAAGTATRLYRLGSPSGLNGLTPGSYYTFCALVWVPTSGINASDVKVVLLDSAGITEGTVVPTPGRWSLMYVTRQIAAAATEAYAEIRVGHSVNLATANVKVYAVLWLVNSGQPVNLIPTIGDNTVTRARDDLYIEHPNPPQPCMVQIEMYSEQAQPGGDATRHIWAFRDANLTPPYLALRTQGTTSPHVEPILQYNAGNFVVASDLPFAARTLEEYTVRMSETQLSVFRGDAEASRAAIQGLPHAWSAPRFYLGAASSTNAIAVVAANYTRVRIVRGVNWTPAELRAMDTPLLP